MRGLVKFLWAVVILALVLASVQVAVRIYDYAGASDVDSVLLQPEAYGGNRIAAPIPLANISDDYVRSQLIRKFAMEYLGVIPNAGELEARATGRRGALRLMSSPDVVAAWRRDVLPEMEKMAAEGKYRTVLVGLRNIRMRDAYYVVPFRTKTWGRANDLDSVPVISGGQELYLRIRFNKKVRDTRQGRRFDAGDFLDSGGPAAAIFEFMVVEAVIK